MEKIKYIGKCLVIEKCEKNKEDKVIVIGDIHIRTLREIEGIDINTKMIEEMISELEEVFTNVGKVDKIVLLGDLKHEFSSLTEEEREGLVSLFKYLEIKCKKIEIIKGNHDNYLLNVISKRGYSVKDYLVLGRYCFLHGDRDFKEIHDSKIKVWILGHLHPAVTLKEDVKSERYKCFLEGEFKKKKIIILPSFGEISEGIDIREMESNLAWNFDLKKFNVKIVSDNLKVLDFGKVENLK